MGVVDRLVAFGALTELERRFFMVAWLAAGPSALAIATLGYRRTEALLAMMPSPGSRKDALGVDAERGEQLVRKAFHWSPARWSTREGGCLPRAVAQYAAHRWMGDDVALCLGVSRPKTAEAKAFDAHAWVEDAGAPPREQGHAPIYRFRGG